MAVDEVGDEAEDVPRRVPLARAQALLQRLDQQLHALAAKVVVLGGDGQGDLINQFDSMPSWTADFCQILKYQT